MATFDNTSDISCDGNVGFNYDSETDSEVEGLEPYRFEPVYNINNNEDEEDSDEVEFAFSTEMKVRIGQTVL